MSLGPRQVNFYKEVCTLYRPSERRLTTGRPGDPPFAWTAAATGVPCHINTSPSQFELQDFILSEGDNIFTLDLISFADEVGVRAEDVLLVTGGHPLLQGGYWKLRGATKPKTWRAMKQKFVAARLAAAPAGISPLLRAMFWFYAFDEASGPAGDSHPAGVPLTPVGNPGSAPGKVGTARQLVAASQQYFTAASSPEHQFGSRDWTLCGWFQPTDAGHGDQFRTLFSKWSQEAAVGNEVACYFVNGQLSLIQSTTGSSAVLVNATSPVGITAGLWYFFAAQYDAAADRLGISLNGGVFTTVACPSAVTGDLAFEVGRWGLFLLRYFNGLVDGFVRFDKLLSGEELAFLYNAGAGRSYAEVAAYQAGQ